MYELLGAPVVIYCYFPPFNWDPFPLSVSDYLSKKSSLSFRLRQYTTLHPWSKTSVHKLAHALWHWYLGKPLEPSKRLFRAFSSLSMSALRRSAWIVQVIEILKQWEKGSFQIKYPGPFPRMCCNSFTSPSRYFITMAYNLCAPQSFTALASWFHPGGYQFQVFLL